MPGDHEWSTTTASYFGEESLGRVTELHSDCTSPLALTTKGQGQTSYLHFLMVLQLWGKGQRGKALNLLLLRSSHTTAKCVFPHTRLKQGDACMCGKKISLGIGKAIPPTRPYWTARDQVCSYSAPWHPWELSLKDPGIFFSFVFRHKAYYRERENILFPISVTDKMRCKVGLTAREFWESILTAVPRNYLDPPGRRAPPGMERWTR